MPSKNHILIIVIILIIVALGSFYFYTKSTTVLSPSTITQQPTQFSSPTAVPEIGISTDSSIVKKELDETILDSDSMDSDFNELDSQASEL
jgi:hypothetical protein